ILPRCGSLDKFLFFFSSRRRHTRSKRDWSSDVCSSDLDIDFDISATYGKLVGMQHTINAVLGMRLNKNLRENSGYTATGFLDDQIGRASCRERVRTSEDGVSGKEKATEERTHEHEGESN